MKHEHGPQEIKVVDEQLFMRSTTDTPSKAGFKIRILDVLLGLCPLVIMLLDGGPSKIIVTVLALALNFTLIIKYCSDITLKFIASIIVTLLSTALFLFLRLAFFHPII